MLTLLPKNYTNFTNIKFTHEIEKKDKISFLDVLLIRIDNRIETHKDFLGEKYTIRTYQIPGELSQNFVRTDTIFQETIPLRTDTLQNYLVGCC